MIDKEYLLSEVDGYSVAEYLGMEIVKRGANHCIICPGHEKRLGKIDARIGNAVLTKKGYRCFACGKSVNAIDMTMEYTGCTYPEALNIVADACGGRNIFELKDGAQQNEKRLPLSADDLELIGLVNSGRSMPIINVSTTLPESDEFFSFRQIDDKYYIFERDNTSILALYQSDPCAYNSLVKSKAKAAMDVYKNAIDKYCSRDSECAELIYILFNENGYLDGDVFFKLKNAFQKKYWRAKEIYDTYSKK